MMPTDTNRLPEDDRTNQQIAPTVIIGLGGTGAEVLTRLRDRFFSALGSLDRIPTIRYLWLDTDTVQATHISSEYRRHREFSKHLGFQPSERVDLVVSDTENYMAHLAQYPHIARWIYPDLSAKRSITEGAGQIRAYGRMALFHNIDLVRARLEEAVRMVISEGARQTASESQIATNTDRLNIIIVSSLAGGTGSGTFLDMAYLTRRVVARVAAGRQISLVGHLLLPRAFGTPDTMSRLYGNGYAALKELNHYNFSPHVERRGDAGELHRSQEHHFTRWWSSNEEPTAAETAPFDICYLVDGANIAGLSAMGAPETDTLFGMIADAIFQDFSTSEFGARKRSTRDNLLKEIVKDARSLYEAEDGFTKLPKRHFAFGLATITFPYDRVKKACAAKLAGHVVDFWLRSADDELQPGDFLKEHFLANIGMEEMETPSKRREKHDLFDALYATDEAGGTIEQLLTRRLGQMARSALEAGTRRDALPWAEFLEEELKKLNSDWRGTQTDDKLLWGDLVRRMRGNQERYLKALQSRLDEQVNRLLNNEHRGIGFAVALLEALDHWLSQEELGKIAIWEQQRRKAGELVSERRERLKDVLQALADLWGMSNGHLLRDLTLRKHLEWLQTAARELYVALMQQFARTLAIEVAQSVRRWIAGDKTDGWRHRLAWLQLHLQRLQEALQQRQEVYQTVRSDTRQIMLYSGPEDLQQIFARAVPDPEATAKRYNAEALQAMGIAVTDLADNALDYEAVGDQLMMVTEPHFTDLAEQQDVLTLFHAKYPPRTAGWNQKIDEVLKACQPWINWETGYTGVRDKVSYEHGRFIMGLAKGRDSRYADFAQQVSNRFIGTMQREFVDLDSRHQIIFYTEVAGFALCQTGAVLPMREQYKRLLADRERHLHTEKNDARFAEVVVLPPDERKQQEQVASAFLIGSLLGLITPREWRDARGNPDITYEYLYKQPGLTPEARYLGNENGVLAYLHARAPLLVSINNEITERKAELQAMTESWVEYLALLRYWIEDYYPVRQVDMGNAATEALPSLETRVLRAEYDATVRRVEPALLEQVAAKFKRIGDDDGFTALNPDGKRALRYTAASAAPDAWWAG